MSTTTSCDALTRWPCSACHTHLGPIMFNQEIDLPRCKRVPPYTRAINFPLQMKHKPNKIGKFGGVKLYPNYFKYKKVLPIICCVRNLPVKVCPSQSLQGLLHLKYLLQLLSTELQCCSTCAQQGTAQLLPWDMGMQQQKAAKLTKASSAACWNAGESSRSSQRERYTQ